MGRLLVSSCVIVLVLAVSGCHLIFPFDVDAPRPDSAPAVDRELPHVDLSPDSSPIPGSWVRIQEGTFIMGSPPDEPCRFSNETRHSVTLSRAYQIMATEVTQGQFGAMMGYNPSHFSTCGDTCPVESVTWHEAAAYCNTLSERKGLPSCYLCTGSGASVVCSLEITSHDDIYACEGYRLPTEAEWEHAYRAETNTALYSGPITSLCEEADPNADKIAWYAANSGGMTHPVLQKEPNAWGLFDMAGNVWEWVHDGSVKDLGPDPVTDPWGDETHPNRLIRGGSWSDDLTGLRAACREGVNHPPADTRSDLIGFRCARTE